jgi:hypothetical protein
MVVELSDDAVQMHYPGDYYPVSDEEYARADERMTPAPDYPAIEMPELLGLRRTLDRSAQRSEEPKPLAKRKLGRNDPCWCGSGKKYKYCHLRSDREKK